MPPFGKAMPLISLCNGPAFTICPDFVYFDHSIHVNKGMGCETCHGRVDEMPFTERRRSLYMAWCLSCHRDPAPNVRPRAIRSSQWDITARRAVPRALS